MSEKLNTSRVFDRMFRIYRDQFGLIIPAAFIVFLIPAVAAAMLRGSTGFAGLLISTAVSLVAIALFQAMMIEAVEDMEDGTRDFTVGSLLNSATRFIGPVIGASILLALGVTVGMIAFVIPGLILMTLWAVVIPVVVMERKPIMSAFGRSYRLVVGNSWRVFGVLVVTFVLTFIVQMLFTQVAVDISNSALAAGVGSLIAQTLVGPLLVLAAAVLYLELRQIDSEPVTDEPAPQNLDPEPWEQPKATR